MADITTTAEWRNLESVFERTQSTTLRDLFAADERRAERYTFDAAGLHVDLSKNLLDDTVVEALVALAAAIVVTFTLAGPATKAASFDLSTLLAQAVCIGPPTQD